ncbi:E3 ubiquitin-protein ligase, putative [Babesia caballi]|uniref:E3 ubiquitin-protein ligase, putative n=1 Tax=Babesia caballi TaxID=5871 RepID=A0AAV4M1W7_BABCB|nr:E3 ubiquitin-protein ligase, putative [Babesia caballi]
MSDLGFPGPAALPPPANGGRSRAFGRGRWSITLAALESGGNAEQMSILSELATYLSYATEDNMAGFPAWNYLRVLTNIVDNPRVTHPPLRPFPKARHSDSVMHHLGASASFYNILSSMYHRGERRAHSEPSSDGGSSDSSSQGDNQSNDQSDSSVTVEDASVAAEDSLITVEHLSVTAGDSLIISEDSLIAGEVTPVITEEIPATTEVISTTAEETPATTEEMSPAANVTPATVEGASATTEGALGTTEVTSPTAEETVATTEVISPSVEDSPATTEVISPSVEDSPATTEVISPSVEDSPVTTEVISPSVEDSPATTEGTPSTTAEDSPATTEVISPSAQETPAEAEETSTIAEETTATGEGTSTTAEGASATAQGTSTTTSATAPPRNRREDALTEDVAANKAIIAATCINNLLDASPLAASFFVSNTSMLKKLQQKLEHIEYIDLAERVLLIYEKLVKEIPVTVVKTGSLISMLRYVDFFPLDVQIGTFTAVNTAVRRLERGESVRHYLIPLVPYLTQALHNNNKKIVQIVCGIWKALIAAAVRAAYKDVSNAAVVMSDLVQALLESTPMQDMCSLMFEENGKLNRTNFHQCLYCIAIVCNESNEVLSRVFSTELLARMRLWLPQSGECMLLRLIELGLGLLGSYHTIDPLVSDCTNLYQRADYYKTHYDRLVELANAFPLSEIMDVFHATISQQLRSRILLLLLRLLEMAAEVGSCRDHIVSIMPLPKIVDALCYTLRYNSHDETCEIAVHIITCLLRLMEGDSISTTFARHGLAKLLVPLRGPKLRHEIDYILACLPTHQQVRSLTSGCDIIAGIKSEGKSLSLYETAQRGLLDFKQVQMLSRAEIPGLLRSVLRQEGGTTDFSIAKADRQGLLMLWEAFTSVVESQSEFAFSLSKDTDSDEEDSSSSPEARRASSNPERSSNDSDIGSSSSGNENSDVVDSVTFSRFLENASIIPTESSGSQSSSSVFRVIGGSVSCSVRPREEVRVELDEASENSESLVSSVRRADEQAEQVQEGAPAHDIPVDATAAPVTSSDGNEQSQLRIMPTDETAIAGDVAAYEATETPLVVSDSAALEVNENAAAEESTSVSPPRPSGSPLSAIQAAADSTAIQAVENSEPGNVDSRLRSLCRRAVSRDDQLVAPAEFPYGLHEGNSSSPPPTRSRVKPNNEGNVPGGEPKPSRTRRSRRRRRYGGGHYRLRSRVRGPLGLIRHFTYRDDVPFPYCFVSREVRLRLKCMNKDDFIRRMKPLSIYVSPFISVAKMEAHLLMYLNRRLLEAPENSRDAPKKRARTDSDSPRDKESPYVSVQFYCRGVPLAPTLSLYQALTTLRSDEDYNIWDETNCLHYYLTRDGTAQQLGMMLSGQNTPLMAARSDERHGPASLFFGLASVLYGWGNRDVGVMMDSLKERLSRMDEAEALDNFMGILEEIIALRKLELSSTRSALPQHGNSTRRGISGGSALSHRSVSLPSVSSRMSLADLGILADSATNHELTYFAKRVEQALRRMDDIIDGKISQDVLFITSLTPNGFSELQDETRQQLRMMVLLQVLITEMSVFFNSVDVDVPFSKRLTLKLFTLIASIEESLYYDMPAWFTRLVSVCPSLFSFDSRRALFDFIGAGPHRLLYHFYGRLNALISSGNVSFRDSDGYTLDALDEILRQHLSSFSKTVKLPSRHEIELSLSIPKLRVKCSRINILHDASVVMDKLACATTGVDTLPRLEVEFNNEVGAGSGPTQEFYSLAVESILKGSNHGGCVDELNGLLYPRIHMPSEPLLAGFHVDFFTRVSTFAVESSDDPEDTDDDSASLPGVSTLAVYQNFKLLGQLCGSALLDRRLLHLPLHPLFWYLCQNPNAEPNCELYALRAVDPVLAQTLSNLLGADNVGAADLDFTYEGIPLVPNGEDIPVTKSNVADYVRAIVKLRLYDGVRLPVWAFRLGFATMVPLESLSIFTPIELSQHIFNSGDQSAFWTYDHLQTYILPDHGYDASSRTYRSLLSLLVSFNETQRRQFLRFCTGTPVLPKQGFGGLRPLMKVVKKGNDTSELPSVMTCSNYLKLPDYRSDEQLRTKVMQAIVEGQGSFYLS